MGHDSELLVAAGQYDGIFMEPDRFDILYEEGPCLAVAKPAGLLTQAPPHIDSLERRLKAYLKARENKPGRVYLGVPHRLDRPVSGVLVMAKHVRAARRLSEQFERRMVDKVYWAVVEGRLSEQDGCWVDQVRKVPDVARAEIVDADESGSRRAVLRYRLLDYLNGNSFVEITIETGRYHQIRVQSAWHGHPIVGDQQYGASTLFGPQRSDERERGIALHARRLSFYHPMTREHKTVFAPLPDYWPDLERSVP